MMVRSALGIFLYVSGTGAKQFYRLKTSPVVELFSNGERDVL